MKKIKILLATLILFAGGVLFFWQDILDFYVKLSTKLPQIEKGITGLVQEAGKQILTPPPLRAEKEAPEAFLTRSGVIKWTNVQRENYGLPPFEENMNLDISAMAKVEDMFDGQYFAHISSSGLGVSDLAESAGYKFIVIGENLAMGNFENDEALVQAWIDSPGHRENILNANYQEIGVAVVKGVFEDKVTWLAVQHFAMPLSACPQPDATLKAEILANQIQIEELQQSLELLRIEIQNTRPRRGFEYAQKIEQYNNLVAQYNALVQETEVLINKYNSQVKLFNDCATLP